MKKTLHFIYLQIQSLIKQFDFFNIFWSGFQLPREFTFWWKEKTNLSHQRRVKTRMKIFIQNQYIIKKLKIFSFFGDEKSSSGIFTLCNKNNF